jgi:phosphohistidine phosphatase SixA
VLYRILVLAAAAAFAPALSHAARMDCDPAKLSALTRAAVGVLRCESKAAASGVASCDGAYDEFLASAFEQAAEQGNCSASAETADIATALQNFQTGLRALLVSGPGTDSCAAAKFRAASRRAKRDLMCRREAAAAGVTVDPACFAPAQESLATFFTRIDGRGACDLTGNGPDAEAAIAEFLHYASGRILGTIAAPVPSGLAASIDLDDVLVTWQAPDAGSSLTKVRLLRGLNAQPIDAFDASATLLYDGSAEAAIDAVFDLLPNTSATPRVYHYAVFGCDADDQCESTGSRTTLTLTVREALVAGGYVLHWRHASADVCSDRTDYGTAGTTAYPDWWKSCDSNCATATARQLNNTGRTESTSIGNSFATLGITVGRVLSSEFCRNMETAQLMNFGPAIEQTQDLTYFVYDEANRCSDTFVLLGEVPAAGTNTALIGHAGNSCSPLSALAWGEAAIYKPDGMGGTLYVDRVLANAWLTLP